MSIDKGGIIFSMGDEVSGYWSQLISGEPASKSNQRRIVLIHGKVRVIKSAKALAYAKSFAVQVTPPREPIEGDVELGAIVWYRTRRPDLDVSLLMDLLQASHVIKNDRQIKVMKAYHQIDKKNPRSLLRVSKLPEDFGLPSWSE